MQIAKTIQIGNLTIHLGATTAYLNTDAQTAPANLVSFSRDALIITKDGMIINARNLTWQAGIEENGTKLKSPWISGEFEKLNKREYESYVKLHAQYSLEEGFGNQTNRFEKMVPGYEKDFKDFLIYLYENTVGDPDIIYYGHPKEWKKCISVELQKELKVNITKCEESCWESPVAIEDVDWNIEVEDKAIAC